MAQSDSEDEGVDDLEFDRTSDAEIDEDIDAEDDTLDTNEAEGAVDDGTEGDDESTEDSDEGSEDEDEDEESSAEHSVVNGDVSVVPGDTKPSTSSPPRPPSSSPTPLPMAYTRSLSPSQLRKKGLLSSIQSGHKSYTIEAICALPHPVPTHALASSLCMTHLLTGSHDGYIRDYDIFPAVNGKNFLTAPQRHHCGVVEGIMKAGQIRFWWENPAYQATGADASGDEETPLSPVFSLLMHSDALWALAGSDTGHINLFTVRHEPGRLIHVMNGHRGHVSAMSMEHDEKGFFSAGWDGDAIQWDLNAGHIVRRFTAHGAQLAAIAVRPVHSPSYSSIQGPDESSSTLKTANGQADDSDAKSDNSFDPLFDDEPDAEGESTTSTAAQPTSNQQPSSLNNGVVSNLAIPDGQPLVYSNGRGSTITVAVPKNAPPLLDSSASQSFSPDILMTASIDGQVILWDRRVDTLGHGVGRLWMSEKTPPWCLSACWSADGTQIYAGRRKNTVDVWDVRQLGRSGPNSTPRLLKTLRNPGSSNVVSCVVAFPDGRHIACASNDNIRLWNVAETLESNGSGKAKGGMQFKIVPGHHGGYVSQMLVDPGARFLVSASSNRGWYGDCTRTVFVHEIKRIP